MCMYLYILWYASHCMSPITLVIISFFNILVLAPQKNWQSIAYCTINEKILKKTINELYIIQYRTKNDTFMVFNGRLQWQFRTAELHS